MYRIETTVIAIPQWARTENLAELAAGQDYVWLFDRKLAKLLRDLDRAEGGHPKLDRYEARRCQVCHMLRIGELARQRRILDESAIDGRKLPCSAECMTRYHQQRSSTAGRRTGTL